jgi:hypothetical protein
MPGSLQLASVPEDCVLPYSLCSAVREDIAWPVVVAGPYADGRQQQRVDGDYSRRSWSLTKRLTPAQWTTLLAFHVARKGSHEPFFWYPKQADDDPTGASPTGRYTVRFEGPLSVSYDLGRVHCSFQLVEVA